MDNLADNTKIACCKACLLAEKMKDCKACKFNVGLLFKAFDQLKAIPVEYPIELRQANRSHLILRII